MDAKAKITEITIDRRKHKKVVMCECGMAFRISGFVVVSEEPQIGNVYEEWPGQEVKFCPYCGSNLHYDFQENEA